MIGYKVGKGGVEIVLNESSLRSSKPCINFRGDERNLGDSAANLERQLLNNTVKDLIRLVGITEKQWEEEKKWWNMPLKFENGIPLVTLQAGGVDRDFTVEALLAMILTKFKDDCSISMNSFILCVAHPIFFDQLQRCSIRNATKIAEINCLKITPDITALSYQYGLFRKKELTADFYNVLFVDIGATKTTLSLIGFSNKETHILEFDYERNLGGRDIDYVLMEHCDAIFQKKHKCSPISNAKTFYKLKEAAESCKKKLSANKDASISIDCLMEDEDLSVNFKRDTFEELCVNVFARFSECFTRFKETLLAKELKYASIELVGGNARIPKLQELITQTFTGAELKKTLNFDECIAQGACIEAAAASPFMSVNSSKLKDYYPFKITLTDPKVPEKVFTVVEVGGNYPSKKSIILMKDADFTLEARYDMSCSKFPVRDDFLARYDVKVKFEKREREKNRKVKVYFEIDNYGIFSVTDVMAVQEYEVEEKIPIKKMPEKKEEVKKDEKKEGEAKEDTEMKDDKKEDDKKKDDKKKDDKKEDKKQEEVKEEFEVKIKVKTTESKLPITAYENPKVMTGARLDELKKYEKDLQERENAIREIQTLKNECEAQSYEFKRRVDEDLHNFIEAEKGQAIIVYCEKLIEWVYGEGEDVTREEYKAKLDGLHALTNGPVYRKYLKEEIERTAEHMTNKVNYVLTRADSPELAHIPQAEKDAVKNESLNELRKMKDVQKNASTHDWSTDFTLDIKAIHKNYMDLEIKWLEILNKPAPKKEEPKKDAKKKDDKDMKDGEAKPDPENMEDTPKPKDSPSQKKETDMEDVKAEVKE